MADGRGQRITVTIEGDGAEFTAGGKTIDFAGYLRAYVEGSDDPEAELADREAMLPALEQGETRQTGRRRLGAEEPHHAAAGRFSEAALTRALEELGIGRPSTYASIIDTIQARDYVVQKGQRAGAHLDGVRRDASCWKSICRSWSITASPPRWKTTWTPSAAANGLSSITCEQFYFGNGQPGLKKQLEKKTDEIDARDVSRILLSEPEGEPPIHVRVGRYGPFLEQGERRASIPDELAPDELTLEKCRELLSQASQAEEPLGICPDTGKPVYLKVGRFGPYVQRGTPDDEEKPQNASLLKGMTPEQVDLPTALKLLSLPRELGTNPENGQTITAFNGRFGPYVKCGEETRSLPADVSPFEVTFEQAIELLKQPKAVRRGFGAKREPLKSFDASPVTGSKVQLLDGRYGLYVTDGTTNATVPKQTPVEEVTFEMALQLLKDRAAAGPSKKKPARKKAARKTVSSK